MKYIYHVFFALFAASASFAATVDLSTLTGDYEALDGDVLTGTLNGDQEHPQPFKITIADGAKVTLSDATINGVNDLELDWAGLTCLGNCTIVLSGTNTVKGFEASSPGIQAAKNEGDGEEYTLTIEGEGSLDASSNGYGAGIGGGFDIDCGNITISSGTVTVTGGESAAGIGGGYGANCGDISISGGTVTATGGDEAAGIGSAEEGTSVDIKISGGEVLATGGDHGAGIGSGYEGTSGDISISGGTVTATGGYSAAGIGSGYGGFIGDISISGGTVTATGGDEAAGIGSGSLGNNVDISISDGTVTAIGGDYAAGIGSGSEGTSRDITITNENGVTKVVATKGEFAYYSVGAGYEGEAGKVTIGDVEGAIAKKIFVFPYPTTPVDVVAVGGKTFAVVDGDYNGEDALSLTEDVSVDNVIFKRSFPAIDGENNYSTIMFPFEISANKVGNVKQVVSFLGIGIDGSNHKYVAVERVWCNEQSNTKCNYGTAKLEAYKPYLIQLEPGKTSISINNTDPLVLKASPTDPGAYDVAQDDDYNEVGDYVFRGVIQAKSWGADDPDVLGTSNAAAYGFAGTATADLTVGQFARVGEGASIRPFRAYIYKKPVSQAAPPAVESSVPYAYQPAPVDDLPDVMDVVVVDRKTSGEERTTVIGKFNSRTGKIRLNRTTRTYDLNGRHVRKAGRMAKGVYLGK